LFHCEKLLIVAITRYFRQYCMGKAAKLRTEALISQAIAGSADPANLSKIRRQVRALIRPSETTYQKYADGSQSDFR